MHYCSLLLNTNTGNGVAVDSGIRTRGAWLEQENLGTSSTFCVIRAWEQNYLRPTLEREQMLLNTDPAEPNVIEQDPAIKAKSTLH